MRTEGHDGTVYGLDDVDSSGTGSQSLCHNNHYASAPVLLT